ncbi:DUF2971 domain-containing protein [Vibrio parahaemolyticus]|uniref:DUF2971 domain-containing protein n=1 Tax=Vibrio parahaemolyticus TaxID=670 RepID=UPI00226B7BF6|nr:DUF2971 domain-containing protein [Vibrio parahaemolyticus]MCX8793788.1 DUF2971 domain-containing protein [Vibrio parahaemolyticus]
MHLFKYYRPDFYFEKSLRYDEIFFASNEQLNDPHDLIIKPYFGNSVEAWRCILKSSEPYDTWNMARIVDIENSELIKAINDEFEGTKVDDSSSLIYAIDAKKENLINIFSQYLLKDREDLYTDSKSASAMCVHFLKEKMIRGWDKRYYSCSFSKDALDPQMWAHYGGGFRGCILIYKTLQNCSLNLRPNIFLNKAQNFKFEEVNYEDKEKVIDILDIDTRPNLIESNLLNKSLFWSYEKEMRLLLSESFGSLRVSSTSQMPVSKKSKIFHHDPDVIKGVIFGSNCSESYKEKVTSMLAEKYSFFLSVGTPAFLTFDSELTSAGKVEIKSGSKCIIHEPGSSQVMKQILEGETLESVLNELGINRC